jgi:hypothetical protein
VDRRRTLVVAIALVVAVFVPLPAVAASRARPAPGVQPAAAGDDMVNGHVNDQKMAHLANVDRPSVSTFAEPEEPSPPPAATPPAQVGDTRTWAALDDEKNRDYAKDYTLRGMGDHIEVWVASGTDATSSGLDFPGSDCRNDERTKITDDQVNYLIGQYDDKILPVESQAFSVAPDRDGTNAILPEALGLPADYYKGAGDHVVVLVDNVRDANFYDPSLTNGNVTYIAGFFYSTFNRYFDRNVMTIDAYDWLHRTGANPPNEPVPGNVCQSKPARPFAYESTFAHEYQHLLESYQDPAEVSWVNEGLSMYAEEVTGYATADIPVTQTGFDAYIQCLLGNTSIQTPANPNPREGGPENSLTVWGDQGQGSEILCDYGAGFSFMLYLEAQYGRDFLSALHRDGRQGLDSLATLLRLRNIPDSVPTVLHRYQAMLAVDAPLEGRTSFSGNRKAYSVPTFHGAINWDNPDAYSTPGAPPNGADYVRLRDKGGKYLSTTNLQSIDFDGASTLPAKPLEWTVAADPPGHAGDPALFSGVDSNLDRAAIHAVTVPAADPSLTFETTWDTEPGWDFGFVQVSSDGGKTWTSLANASTTAEHDPGAIPAVAANVPGYTGASDGWVPQRFDLSRWAGQSVLLSFRMVTDTNTEGTGWWVDDIAVGGQVISDGSSTAGFRSATEVNPIKVTGFTVQLVGYSSSGRGPVFVTPLTLNANFDAHVKIPWLWKLYGADVVAALVAYDEPTEQITQYAPYSLTANGVLQPGGAAAPTVPPPATTTTTVATTSTTVLTTTTTVPTTATTAVPVPTVPGTTPPTGPTTVPSTVAPPVTPVTPAPVTTFPPSTTVPSTTAPRPSP